MEVQNDGHKDDCEPKENGEPDCGNFTPIKKVMKQARLPFKVLAPKPAKSPVSSTVGQGAGQKKRKLSDPQPVGPNKMCKTPKNYLVDEENQITIIDSDSDGEPNDGDNSLKPLKSKVVGVMDKFVKKATKAKQSESVKEALSDKTNNAPKQSECDDSKIDTMERNTKSEHVEDDAVNTSCNDAAMDGDSLDNNVTDCDTTVPDGLDSSIISDNSDELNTTSQDNSPTTKLSSDNNSGTENITNSKSKSAKSKETRLARQEKRKAIPVEKERKRIEEKERKEQERLEAKKKRDEEKQILLEQKNKEKEEKLKQKEEERKKKQEEVRLKEEERKKKQEEKDEEKRKKQELIDAKNEEKRKKEEEKLKAEEELKMKKEKEKAMFTKFFTKSDKQGTPAKLVSEEKTGPFIVFEVKENMRLAPSIRVTEEARLQKERDLDRMINSKSDTDWIKEVQSKCYTQGKFGRTYPVVRDDVEILPEVRTYQLHAKLLQFHENYRPAYYGTWRKNSKLINPRNPLKKDEVLLDYDVDSDEEWEEEEPGESLSHSEGEGSDNEEKDEVDDDADDEGFFVPHGYLSEGEGCEDEEDDVTPERMKARQLAKAKAWDAEMKKKQLELLRPVCVGCLWADLSHKLSSEWNMLQQFAAVPLVSTPIPTQSNNETTTDSPQQNLNNSKLSKGAKIFPVPDEAMPELIRLIHGNFYGLPKLVKEFREFWRRKTLGLELVNHADERAADLETSQGDNNDSQVDTSHDENNDKSMIEETKVKDDEKVEGDGKEPLMSKRQLEARIRKISVYEKRSVYNRRCWYVKQEVLEEHKLTELPVPTDWHWLTRTNIARVPKKSVKEVGTPGPPDNKKPTHLTSTPNIKQFAVTGYTPPPSSPLVSKIENSESPNSSTPSIKKFAVSGLIMDSTPNKKNLSAKDDKMDGNVTDNMHTPRSDKHSNISETPRRTLSTKSITPSSLLNQEQDSESPKLGSTPNTDSKVKTQRTLMSMFSPQTKTLKEINKSRNVSGTSGSKSDVIILDDEPSPKKLAVEGNGLDNSVIDPKQTGGDILPGNSADDPMELD